MTASAERRRDFLWTVWAMAAAFGTYFCMYAFRKPFTASSYADSPFGGIDFKTLLVTAQVLGYTASKFLGIKFVTETPPHRRTLRIAGLVLFAEAMLVAFGLAPRPWNVVFLFLNGLPLGMVFGLVISTLEGRQMTEALAAGLCASFIVADGAMKSIGAWLLEHGVSEDWMPSVAGSLFLLPIGGCLAMLQRIPPPSARDIVARSERSPMNGAERRRFLSRWALGLTPLALMYFAVTIVRSIRADFAPELWRELDSPARPETFALTEIAIAVAVLALNGSAVLIRNNRRAFFVSLATCGLGFLVMLAALIAHRQARLNGLGFMTIVGLGLYLPYVAIHTTVFERLLAMTRDRGTIGFLMTIADAVGYLGYVAVMLFRNAFAHHAILDLFLVGCWLTVGVAALFLAIAWRTFAHVGDAHPQPAIAQSGA